MKCEIRKVGDITLFVIHGNMSFNDMEVARALIFGEIARSSANKFIIDLGGVVSIDSSGFGFVVSIHKAVVARKGAFAISRPDESINRVMRTLGLTRVFKIYASEEEAINAIGEVPVYNWKGEMYLQWNDSYSVGVKTFDNEHKILFGLINRLHTGMKEKGNRHEAGKVLGELVAYVGQHFDSEETVMRIYKYPDYQEHKDEHDAFAAKVGENYRRFQNDGAVLSVEVLGFIVEWLHKHLDGTDKLYTQFLNEKGVR